MKNIFIFLLFIMFPATSANSQSEGILNRLLAPGPLIEGHKDLEKSDCLKCHDAGKGVPDSKCLDCHKDIRPFVENKKGFHGLNTQTCMTCHSDHKGRDFNSIKVEEKSFDHNKTGYSLEGKHAELQCTKCHLEKNKQGETRYLGKKTSCVSCHKKKDPHFFKNEWAKKDCNVCHGTKTWKDDIKFNHERDTKYSLKGKHEQLKCTDCHGPNKKMSTIKYTWTDLKSKQCLSCHQDFHKDKIGKKYGGNCATCHSETNWKIPKFDHSATKYPLRGKHETLKCVDCHKQKKPTLELKNFKFADLSSQCLSCHKDYHKFDNLKSKSFGNLSNCIQCHSESNWKDTHDFDHNKHTKYKIDGKHLELNCNECHLPQKKGEPPPKKAIYHWGKLDQKTCESCHTNPHIGHFKPEMLKKKCTSCHTTQSWTKMNDGKDFDHSKTRFPLTGNHANASCKDCHNIDGKKVYKFASVKQKFCIDCHKNVHINQFSKNFSSKSCAECHTTKNFTERMEFDHESTGYKLAGEHSKLKCSECHLPTPAKFTQIVKKKEPGNMSNFKFSNLKSDGCVNCHKDYHRGQLSKNCSECHNELGWKKTSFDHNKTSDFVIAGKHTTVACKECHKPISNEYTFLKKDKVPLIRYKPLNSDCSSCHKDVHKGDYGNSCNECHTEKGWRVTKDFHKNFTLSGIHYSLECSECHRGNQKLAGLSQECLACHQKDDIHKGTLPNCQECHRQQFWENAEYKHSLSRFPLRGAHRTLDCIECHNRGVYQGLPTECSQCHLNDAINATSLSHSPIGNFINCTNCHRNQFSFSSAP